MLATSDDLDESKPLPPHEATMDASVAVRHLVELERFLYSSLMARQPQKESLNVQSVDIERCSLDFATDPTGNGNEKAPEAMPTLTGNVVHWDGQTTLLGDQASRLLKIAIGSTAVGGFELNARNIGFIYAVRNEPANVRNSVSKHLSTINQTLCSLGFKRKRLQRSGDMVVWATVTSDERM